MAGIDIKQLDEHQYEVRIDAAKVSTHVVTVRPEYVAKLVPATVSAERLLAASFDFLLNNEPNTSILRRFDLSDIGRYFPSYEGNMRSRFARGG